MTAQEFAACFEILTEHAPFPWQAELYHRFAQGDIPSHADLPTGLGKTSVIAVWLIALATHPTRVPRRLAYVVNRRTVVDQTTAEVEKLRANLVAAGLDGALSELCALPVDCPLAVSTLRGASADNREWSADPCRPAVIVGTVDLIGSRLLFSGYRAGYKTRPLFAGLLGQDTLIVHDEAHLEPAFQELLTAIAAEQRKDGDARPVEVMQLSATARGTDGDGAGLVLTQEDEAHQEVARRLRAPKLLSLHPLDDPKRLPETIAHLALRHEGSDLAVLVYARRVADVEEIRRLIQSRLPKESQNRVATLTGTMRGLERDELVKSNPAFRRFLPPTRNAGGTGQPPEPGTFYLVCTSAGEVGVNLSADHLVCDLTPYESMAQRLGRVNRFGSRTDTQVDVVHPARFDETSASEERTLALLGQLGGDASPGALRRLPADARLAAFSLSPKPLPTSSLLFDAWSLTSVRDPLPGRPAVAPYLHGPGEDDKAPETQVAWREEVERLATSDDGRTGTFTPDDLQQFLDDYPLKPVELLRDRPARVAEVLARLARKMPEAPLWLVDDDDDVHTLTLAQITDKNDRRNKDRLNNVLVLLPPRVGGLSINGTLDAEADPREGLDVSHRWTDEHDQPRRVRMWSAAANEPPQPRQTRSGMRLIRKIDTRPDLDDDDDTDEQDAAEGEASADARRFWWWYERPAGADNAGSEFGEAAVEISTHNTDVEGCARAFVEKLALDPAQAAAVVFAARRHDLGKRRVGWQRSIGNFQKDLWLAKSGGRRAFRDPGFAYRHEFGSVLDIETMGVDLNTLVDVESRDLALHLIAAHHGRARPHFSPAETLDPDYSRARSDSLAAETPRRFARLQRRYGRWGLAFLESLLRAADYAASANPSETLKENP